MDESPVNTEGLKIIQLNELTDFSEADTAISEIAANGIPVLMKIVTALPEEYQESFLSLMN